MVMLPNHIAIIMDGNGRWAQNRLLPRVAGHHRGVEAARTVVQSCIQRNIKVLSLFAFSSENWQRPAAEVKLLMSLLQKLLSEEVNQLHSNNVKLRVLGAAEGLSAQMQLAIKSAEHLTRNNTGLQLNIALNYGGRWDIVQATRQLADLAMRGEIKPDDITQELFAGKLTTAGLPDPDLLIRTSGEQRLSNFLLWQMAYSEIYWTEVLWPDFADQDLSQALEFYALRQRRFGLVENV